MLPFELTKGIPEIDRVIKGFYCTCYCSQPASWAPSQADNVSAMWLEWPDCQCWQGLPETACCWHQIQYLEIWLDAVCHFEWCYLQGSFCVCAQPMRDDDALQHRLWLAGRMYKMIPVSGPRFNRDHVYRYRDLHYQDEMVVRLSNLYNRNFWTGKQHIYIVIAPRSS